PLPSGGRLAVVNKNEAAVVTEIDEATTQLLGYTADEMVGHRTLEFLDPEDHQRAIASWIDMLRAPGARRRVRLRHRHRDGTWLWFEMTNHNLLHDPAHGYVVAEMVDITDEMAAQDATVDGSLRQELETRATYDALTQCGNRASVLSLLEDELSSRRNAGQSASRTAGGIGVIFVDLDRFKAINDQLGHAAGDDLL